MSLRLRHILLDIETEAGREIFPKAVDGRVNSSGLSFAVDEHDSVDQLL